ncbi:MAG: proline racemase family protein [Planctomycetaceae bacterium]|nr:proline racemase family protein [Planctomycetaceae bacterium]
MSTADYWPSTIQVFDSHTEGEPTRVVVSGEIDLGGGSVKEQCQRFRQHWDGLRSAIVNEPRGSDILVGAWICKPANPDCTAGLFFFNNVGMLGMCGHGTIGAVITLARLGRLETGKHLLETPVGVIEVHYAGGAEVSLRNVPSYLYQSDVELNVPEVGTVKGSIGFGGNWFFMVESPAFTISRDRIEELTDLTWNIRQVLDRQGITGKDGAMIDHVELYGPPADPRNDACNFVLCPGKAYDRSPCGTGTSAKVATLLTRGKLKPGQIWRQESVTGGLFEASAEMVDGKIIPITTGRAWLTGESLLYFDPQDPLLKHLREADLASRM